MADKNTKDMLIRDVPEVLWLEIDRFCRRNKIVRRRFIEMAFKAMQQNNPRQRSSTELQQIEENLDEVERKLNVYERFYKIRSEISQIRALYKGEIAPIRRKLADELEGLQELLGDLFESSLEEAVAPGPHSGVVEFQPKSEQGQDNNQTRRMSFGATLIDQVRLKSKARLQR